MDGPLCLPNAERMCMSGKSRELCTLHRAATTPTRCCSWQTSQRALMFAISAGPGFAACASRFLSLCPLRLRNGALRFQGERPNGGHAVSAVCELTATTTLAGQAHEESGHRRQIRNSLRGQLAQDHQEDGGQPALQVLLHFLRQGEEDVCAEPLASMRVACLSKRSADHKSRLAFDLFALALVSSMI